MMSIGFWHPYSKDNITEETNEEEEEEKKVQKALQRRSRLFIPKFCLLQLNTHDTLISFIFEKNAEVGQNSLDIKKIPR